MKQVDTKKLVLGCLVIMILMILYTKVQTGIERSKREAEVAAALEETARPNSLLTSGQLIGFSDNLDREVLSRRLTFAIILVTIASIILGFEGAGGFRPDGGSLLVLGATCCWGLENN